GKARDVVGRPRSKLGRRHAMRPVRFVALSEDGQALVLADEVGPLPCAPPPPPLTLAAQGTTTLAPLDIQARIRAGESADDVARVAGVPVDRVLRYAGPGLQERAMPAQHAARTTVRASPNG